MGTPVHQTMQQPQAHQYQQAGPNNQNMPPRQMSTPQAQTTDNMAAYLAQGAQGMQPNFRPSPRVQHARPPPVNPSNIDSSDFPFDYRLLHMIPLLSDPNWRSMMQQRQPATFQAVTQAAMIAPSVPPDILSRMRQLAHMMRSPQVQTGPGQSQQQQQGQAQRVRPPSADGQPVQPGQGMTPQASAQSPQIGRPPAWQGTPTHGPGAARTPSLPPQTHPQSQTAVRPRPPPPPHIPQSPAIDISGANRRPSSKGKREGTAGTGEGMPPPAWIPNASVRPDADSGDRPGSSRGSSIPVKEWEGVLRTQAPLYRITPLPDEDPEDPTFGGLLPILSEAEQKAVQRWIQTDKAYLDSMDGERSRVRKRMTRWAQSRELDIPWWQPRRGETPFNQARNRLTIIWPDEKIALRARTSHRNRREIRFTPAQLRQMAHVEDQVIPVRIELEHDQWKIKDTFMWNCVDTLVTPELFAQCLCHDFGVPEGIFVSRIAAVIRDRVKEYQNQVLPVLARPTDATRGKIDPEGDGEARAMYEIFRRAREDTPEDAEHTLVNGHASNSSEDIKTERGDEDDAHVKIVDANDEDVDMAPDLEEEKADGHVEEKPMTVEEATASFAMSQRDDLRILIKVGDGSGDSFY